MEETVRIILNHSSQKSILSSLGNDLPSLQESVSASAVNEPKFGSVTQSSNGSSGVTTDTASIRFSAGDVTLTINKSDGSILEIGPADSVTKVTEDPLFDRYTFQREDFLNESDDEILIAAVFVDWNDDDAELAQVPVEYYVAKYSGNARDSTGYSNWEHNHIGNRYATTKLYPDEMQVNYSTSGRWSVGVRQEPQGIAKYGS